jgi:hypothetical protein
MAFDERHVKVRHHLETAVRLQRESWDNALAVQDITGNCDRGIYALVTELAGGLKDDEAIAEDIIDTLDLIPGLSKFFRVRVGTATKNSTGERLSDAEQYSKNVEFLEFIGP